MATEALGAEPAGREAKEMSERRMSWQRGRCHPQEGGRRARGPRCWAAARTEGCGGKEGLSRAVAVLFVTSRVGADKSGSCPADEWRRDGEPSGGPPSPGRRWAGVGATPLAQAVEAVTGGVWFQPSGRDSQEGCREGREGPR